MAFVPWSIELKALKAFGHVSEPGTESFKCAYYIAVGVSNISNRRYNDFS